MSSGKVFLSILAGAAVGALTGILIAPAKGSKTRKNILRKGEDYYDSFKGKLDELLHTATEKFEKVKEDVAEYAEKKMGKPEEAEMGAKTVEGQKS